jgi:hypothetical protein
VEATRQVRYPVFNSCSKEARAFDQALLSSSPATAPATPPLQRICWGWEWQMAAPLESLRPGCFLLLELEQEESRARGDNSNGSNGSSNGSSGGEGADLVSFAILPVAFFSQPLAARHESAAAASLAFCSPRSPAAKGAGGGKGARGVLDALSGPFSAAPQSAVSSQLEIHVAVTRGAADEE